MAVRLNNDRMVRPRTDGSTELVSDGRFIIPQVGLQIGADCRAYRDANGNVVLEAATGKRILVPAEGVQVGADCRAYRDANGDLTFGDSQNYQDRKLQDLLVRRSKRAYLATDFASPAEISWAGVALAGGNVTIVAGTANHPGQRRIFSAVAANSGYYYMIGSGAGSTVIQGGDKVVSIFQVTDTNSLLHIGFTYAMLPTTGTWIEINSLTAKGYTNNGTGSSNATGTTYLSTINTWYRSEIETSASGAIAYFRIYDCATQALIWSESLNPNYGDEKSLFPMVSAQSNAAGGPYMLGNLDFAEYECGVDLIR